MLDLNKRVENASSIDTNNLYKYFSKVYTDFLNKSFSSMADYVMDTSCF